MNILDATARFMERGRQNIEGGDFSDPDTRSLRRKLLLEELREYIEAEGEDDLVETVDGLLDIVVIAWGSLLAYVGEEKAKKAAAEVARSNLDKVIGEGLPIFNEIGKIVKPEGWRPPDIAGAIE